MPVAGLGAGDADDAVVVPAESGVLVRLLDEGLHHRHLGHDLGEAARGHVHLVVLLLLQGLPAHRGLGGEPHIDGEDGGQQRRQGPPVDRRDDQDRRRGDQHGEGVVGEEVQELGQLGDGAVQARGDLAGELVVEVALGQGEQLGEVAGGEDGAHPGRHDIAPVAAHGADQGGDQLDHQEGPGQPEDGLDGGVHGLAAVEPGDDLIRGGAGDERDGQGEQRRDHRRDDDPHVERGQFAGEGQDARQRSHGGGQPREGVDCSWSRGVPAGRGVGGRQREDPWLTERRRRTSRAPETVPTLWIPRGRLLHR